MEKQQSNIKCQPLSEDETKRVLMVPAIIAFMIEGQDINEECHKLVIDTLNALEQHQCIAANRDDRGRLFGIRIILHNLINKIDEVSPIILDTREKFDKLVREHLEKVRLGGLADE